MSPSVVLIRINAGAPTCGLVHFRKPYLFNVYGTYTLGQLGIPEYQCHFVKMWMSARHCCEICKRVPTFILFRDATQSPGKSVIISSLKIARPPSSPSIFSLNFPHGHQVSGENIAIFSFNFPKT